MNTSSEFTPRSFLAAIGCWIGFLFGPNVMVAASNSNFMDALIKDFGASYASVSTALAVGPLVVAVSVPLAGRLMDLYGPRKVLIPGVFVFALSFLLLSRISAIWQFGALQIVLSVGAAMNSSVGFAKVISSWFDRHRGLVLGACVAFGAGLGQMAMPKVSQWLIDTYGWRGGYTGFSMILFFVSLPIIISLVRPNVKAIGQAGSLPSAHATADVPGLTVGQAFRNISFWTVFLAIMFTSMSLIGTLVHARTMLEEHGFTADIATTAMSVSFAGVLLGEFSSGLVVDRFSTPRVFLPYFTSALIGVVIFHTAAGSVPILLAGALLMGMGLGGEVGQNAYLVSRYCGLKSFATLYGFTFAASNLGISIGIFAMGKIHDIAGSYGPMVYVFGTTMSVAVLCIASLRPFVFLPRKTH